MESLIRIDPDIVPIEKLDGLYIPTIPMTAPTINDIIVLGADTTTTEIIPTTLLCRVDNQDRSITISRRDGRLINARNIGTSDDSEILSLAQLSLRLKKHSEWYAEIDPATVTCTEKFLGFLAVIATRAHAKQSTMN